MKKYSKIIFGIMTIMPALSFADGLVPKNCTINNIYHETGIVEVDQPLRFVRMLYDGAVEVSPGASGYIMCGNEKVAETASIEVSNDYLESVGTIGNVFMRFSEECLPKGEKYTFYLPAGSINLVDNKDMTNDEILYPFEIPTDIGLGNFHRDNGCEIISSKSDITCSWGYETSPVGCPEWELYREGDLVRKYPAYIGWDWGIGYADFSPSEEIHFEKGVRYSLVLPEGSVRASREDIVNKRSVLEFVGGYADLIPSPAYNECRLSDKKADMLTEVNFYFDTPVSLVPGKPILFYEENHRDDIIVTALPTISYYDGEKTIVTVDFYGPVLFVYLDPEKVYTLEMPEGTVVTSKGDIAVNKTQTTNIGGTTGLSENKIGESKIKVDGKSISVSGINSGVSLTLYDISGRVVKTITGSSEYVSMEVEDTGIYILVVGGKSFKVVVR